MEEHKMYDQPLEGAQLAVMVEELDERDGVCQNEDCSTSTSPAGLGRRRSLRTVIKEEEEEELDDNEEIQKEIPWRKRKRKAVAFHFTQEQEENLVEWFRTNPRFYNKKCRGYKKTDVKEKMMENKAKEFIDADGNECTPAQLKMWWTNMRTYYGKLSKGWPNPTEREQWIKSSFAFLWDHIIRITFRRGCKLRNVVAEPPPENEEDIGWEVMSIQEMSENTVNEDHETESSEELTPSKRKREEPKDSNGIQVVESEKKLDKADVETIEKICLNVMRTVAPPPGLSVPAIEELENFARDIVSSMRRVPEECWNDVKAEMMMVIKNYSRVAPTQFTTTGVGCATVAPVPAINSGPSPINPSTGTSPRLSNLRHGNTLPQGPIPVTISPFQYGQHTQPLPQPLPPQVQQHQPGVLTVGSGTMQTATPATTTTNSNTATNNK